MPTSVARAIAQEIYIWGYPLVIMDAAGKMQTNIEVPRDATRRAPLSQFTPAETCSPATFRDVVRPNFDPRYSVAWLDVGPEPLVLTLPRTDRHGRIDQGGVPIPAT